MKTFNPTPNKILFLFLILCFKKHTVQKSYRRDKSSVSLKFPHYCAFKSGAPVTGSLIIFSCSAWRSWSQVCSRWCCGCPTPLNCSNLSSMKSLSCCPGGRTRKTKVFIIITTDMLTAVGPAVFMYVIKTYLIVLSDLLDCEMSSTRTACEEAMTVLEEVIMFIFQQSVYYLTKVGILL